MGTPPRKKMGSSGVTGYAPTTVPTKNAHPHAITKCPSTIGPTGIPSPYKYIRLIYSNAEVAVYEAYLLENLPKIHGHANLSW